jgi:hypothetical protein
MNERTTPMVDAARRAAQLRQEAAGAAVAGAEDDPQFEPDIETEAYSMISADRQRKIMVEFRMLDGNRKARAYSYLVGIDFNPSEGIIADFSGETVAISGRNLLPLLDGLVSQRIAVVREMDELHAEANLPKDATVVTKIEIKPVE